MSKPVKYPQQIIDDAREISGWNDHSVIQVLCDFVFAQGEATVLAFEEYVTGRIAEEEAASDEA